MFIQTHTIVFATIFHLNQAFLGLISAAPCFTQQKKKVFSFHFRRNNTMLMKYSILQVFEYIIILTLDTTITYNISIHNNHQQATWNMKKLIVTPVTVYTQKVTFLTSLLYAASFQISHFYGLLLIKSETMWCTSIINFHIYILASWQSTSSTVQVTKYSSILIFSWNWLNYSIWLNKHFKEHKACTW